MLPQPKVFPTKHFFSFTSSDYKKYYKTINNIAN